MVHVLPGLLGAGMVIGGVFLPWTSRGTGSSMSLVTLAGVAGRSVLAPRWLVVAVAALPLLGALLAATVVRERPAGWLAATIAVLIVVVLVTLWRAGASGIGVGALLAGGGTVLSGVAARRHARARSDRRRP